MTTIRVTEAPQGTHPQSLARRASQDLSTVFLVARPDSGHPAGPAQDILRALGTRDDIVAAKGSAGEHSKLAVVWLAANRTRTVVVSSPQTLKDESLRQYAELSTAAGCDLLLACDPGRARGTADRLACWGAIQDSWTDALAALPPVHEHGTPVVDNDPVEWDRTLSVPRADFTLFRDTCRRLLPTDDFARVDSLYAATARRVFHDAREPVQHDVFAELMAALETSPSLDDCIVVLRATQAGLFRRGWLLGADLTKVIGRLTSETRGVALTDAQWRSLRAYRSPTRAAVCALSAIGYGTREIRTLTLADASEGSPLLRDAPALALPYLRAQRISRYGAGVRAEDWLLNAERAAVSNAIKDGRRDLGLRLACTPTAAKDERVRLRTSFGFSLLDIRTQKRQP